jgi:hypothetical protein
VTVYSFRKLRKRDGDSVEKGFAASWRWRKTVVAE